ncbi:MAG: sterol desaturase family protein [Myxococcus sp.]|nr:sterol desaturase family protein [Myxococcus sp.]
MPVDTTQVFPMVVALVTLHATRYLLAAGSAWLFFWAWRANPMTTRRRLQHAAFTREDVRRELLTSLRTALVFGALFGVVYAGLPVVPLSHTGARAALEFSAWLGFLLLVHDTYFYWSHRLAHHPRVFPWLHALHHRSRNPSPFAALSFGVLDAVVQVAWAVPLVRWVPVPSVVWLVFSFLAIGINVIGHCGVEPYPLSWQQHPVLKWLNFATMHNQHHVAVRGNYGLYSSAWDRWMGTLLR